MVRWVTFLLGWLVLLAAGPVHPVSAEMDAELLGRIQMRLSPETNSVLAGAFPNEWEDIVGFYALRKERPGWINANGWSQAGREAIACIAAVSHDGLDPEQYHCGRLTALDQTGRNGSPGAGPTFDWDVLLTHGFIRLLRHLVYGCVNPDQIDDLWSMSRSTERDIAALAANAAETGRVREIVQSVLPVHPGYQRLREALALYRDVQRNGGWPTIPLGDGIRPGESDPRIPLIRKRMAVTDDLPLGVSQKNPLLYDAALVNAVKRFQTRHGLPGDGVIGTQTIQAMNVPVERRIQQLLVNLERWRWLGQDWGKRYIAVNIADYSLEAVDDGTTVLDMRVVVGQTYRRTPVFSERLRYVVLNPAWNVPKKIAVEDKLPLIKKDPGYLIKNRIHVFSAREENGPELNPYTIDWSRLHADYFPYRLKQDPGARNALGRVKFLLPNKYAIYLHDSPQRELFRRTNRGFSSGCIRLEKPVELAVEVLKNSPEWNRERILSTIQSGVTTVIPVRDPIMVYLLYWTAWVDDQGTVNFREDIYERDRLLWAALEQTVAHAPEPTSISMGDLTVKPGPS